MLGFRYVGASYLCNPFFEYGTVHSLVVQDVPVMVENFSKHLSKGFADPVTSDDSIIKEVGKASHDDCTASDSNYDLEHPVYMGSGYLGSTYILGQIVTRVYLFRKHITKSVVDSVSALDILKRAINGICIRWNKIQATVANWSKIAKSTTLYSKVARPITNYTKQERPSATWSKQDKPATTWGKDGIPEC